MAILHVRSFPENLYRLLSKQAKEDKRSLSAEVIVLLKRILLQPSASQRDVLSELDRVRFRPPAGKKIPPSVDLLREDRDA